MVETNVVNLVRAVVLIALGALSALVPYIGPMVGGAIPQLFSQSQGSREAIENFLFFSLGVGGFTAYHLGKDETIVIHLLCGAGVYWGIFAHAWLQQSGVKVSTSHL